MAFRMKVLNFKGSVKREGKTDSSVNAKQAILGDHSTVQHN